MGRGNDVVDRDAARELQLFVENDGDLYRQQGAPILKNLATKMAKGVYRHDGAVKLYGYYMESGAKKYVKDMGDGSAWHEIFGPATRRAAAEEFALAFEAGWDHGEYRGLLPKKYQKAHPWGPEGALAHGTPAAKEWSLRGASKSSRRRGAVRRLFQFFLVGQGVGPAVLVRAKSREDALDLARGWSGIPTHTASVALPRTVKNWRAEGKRIIGEEPTQATLPEADTYEEYRGYRLTPKRDGSGGYAIYHHGVGGLNYQQDATGLDDARRTVDAMLGD